MLQSITVFNEFGNGHRLCADVNMEVVYVVCRLRGAAATDAVFGAVPGERGRDLNPARPRTVGAISKRARDRGGCGWRRVSTDYFTATVSVLL